MGAAGSNAIKRIQDMLVEKTRVRVDASDMADYLFVDDQGIAHLTTICQQNNIQVASHDDDSPDKVAAVIGPCTHVTAPRSPETLP